jgi:2-methylcitrate dehydratase PrpD
MAERGKLGGDVLLPAVAAGYEMACRVGFAGAPPSMYKRGFHPTSAMGAFGAAVTAAALMNLSCEQMLNAVGIAGSFASGNMEYLAEGTLTKRVQPGQAAQAGILAALLAERGYTGPATILEGEFGFLHAYSDAAVPSRLTDDLGKTWEIELTGIKAFGCCRYMQSPMEASLRAVRGQEWKPEDVQEIRVGLVSPGWGLVADPIEDKYEPKTRVDGQFSLPFGVATALIHGQATVNEFREEQLKNPKILALAKRVTIHHDDALDRAYPALWPSWSEIHLKDGHVLRGAINTTKGEPDNPMTPDEVRAKFTNLGGTYWSAAELKSVMDWVENAEQGSVRALMNFARVGTVGR